MTTVDIRASANRQGGDPAIQPLDKVKTDAPSAARIVRALKVLVDFARASLPTS